WVGGVSATGLSGEGTAPQQVVRPSADVAQTWSLPAARARVRPRVSTFTGFTEPAPTVPVPSWPLSFLPQHCTSPSASRTQVKPSPSARSRSPFRVGCASGRTAYLVTEV